MLHQLVTKLDQYCVGSLPIGIILLQIGKNSYE